MSKELEYAKFRCAQTERMEGDMEEMKRNIEEIEEVIKCDADAETKCKMISNILTAKPHYFKEPQKARIINGRLKEM